MTMQRYLLLFLAAVTLAAQPRNSDAALGAARHLEEAEGNYPAAIEAYKKFLAQYGKDRALAAKALVRMGQCYEKLGDAESRKIYERVVRDYSDQKEASALARARLGNSGRAPEGNQSMVSRRLWSGPEATPVGGSVSADGRFLSFVEKETGDLAIRDLTTEKNRRLTKGGNWASDYAGKSTFSPDANEIAYEWYTGSRSQIRVIPTSGTRDTEPQVLLNNEDVYSEPFSWTPDGKGILALLSRNDGTKQIAIISLTHQPTRILKSLEWRYPTRLSLSADGRYIAYDAPVARGSQNRDVYLLATDGSREIPLLEHPATDRLPLWTPDGKGVLFASDRGGNEGLWFIRVADGKPDGVPVLIKSDMGAFETQGITRNGSYHYTLGGMRPEFYAAEMDPQTGRLAKPAVPAAPGRAVGVWSPDGQFVAYPDPQSGGGKPIRIVIQSLQSGDRREFTTNLTITPGVRWFPDGRSLLVAGGNPLGGIPISLHRLDVRTGEDLLRRTISVRYGSDVGVSSDGSRVYYTTYDDQSGVSRIMAHDFATDSESELYSTSPYKLNLALSPDGGLIALVVLDEAKRASSLAVMPASGGPVREVFRARPGDVAGLFGIEWTPDGKHLLFAMPVSPGTRNMDLWRVPITGGEAKPLGLGPGIELIAGTRLHPDGRQLSFVAARKRWEAWSLSNFLPAMIDTK